MRRAIKRIRAHDFFLVAPQDYRATLHLAADKVENVVWDNNLAPRNFRYLSYDPLLNEYVFIESADSMADRVLAEAVENIAAIHGVEITDYDHAQTQVNGVESLIDTIKSLHKQAKRDTDNNNTKL
jgi:hypothetical protein